MELLHRLDASVSAEQRAAVWFAANDNTWGLLVDYEPSQLTQTAAVLLDRGTVEATDLLHALIASRTLCEEDCTSLFGWAVLFTAGGSRPYRPKATRILSVAAELATSDGITAFVCLLHEVFETDNVDVFGEFGLPRTPRIVAAARRARAQWAEAVGMPHGEVLLVDAAASEAEYAQPAGEGFFLHSQQHGLVGAADYAEEAADA